MTAAHRARAAREIEFRRNRLRDSPTELARLFGEAVEDRSDIIDWSRYAHGDPEPEELPERPDQRVTVDPTIAGHETAVAREFVTPRRAAVDDWSGEAGDQPDLSPFYGWGHHGEIWLDETDGDWVDSGTRHRTKKAIRAQVEICDCEWPLPIRRQWSACEFGGQRAWRSTNPAMESVLDDDPLLYRVMPWLWTFCRCNGCLDVPRVVGRPPERCTKCSQDAKNSQRRRSYALKSVIELLPESAGKRGVFVP
ncbi:MAG: hypothetical protein WBB00_07890 [Mycobacterium sp.]